jgi:hypothetical protein
MTKIIISNNFDKDGNCLLCGINHAYGEPCDIDISLPNKKEKK